MISRKIQRGMFMNSTLLWEIVNFVLLAGIVVGGIKIFKIIFKMSKTSKKVNKIEKDISEIKDKIDSKN